MSIESRVSKLEAELGVNDEQTDTYVVRVPEKLSPEAWVESVRPLRDRAASPQQDADGVL